MHAIAQAGSTKVWCNMIVFPRRRAMRWTRLNRLNNHSTKWSSASGGRSVSGWAARPGFGLIRAVAFRSSTVKLRRWSASYAASQMTCFTPFSRSFARAASACVLQILASTSMNSNSGSRFNALKGLSHRPGSVQRRNRECTVRQLPGAAGRLRQEDALRASQRIASGNKRLSALPRPRSPFQPGTRGSMITRCLSKPVCSRSTPLFDRDSNRT